MFGEDIETYKQYFPRISQSDLDSKFRELVEIGQGSFGVVKRGINSKGQIVALKYYKKEAMKSFKRVFQEMHNLKKLNHPNIIKLYDCFSLSDNDFIMVTEYCSQGDLSNWLKKGLKQKEKYSLCLQLAEGLEYSHQHNIIHRDLKPQNIFINASGVAKIGDFGCSTEQTNPEDLMKSILGSPAYMDKPIMKGKYNRMVDIYSLGLVYFYIFKGNGLLNGCKSFDEIEDVRDRLYTNYDEEMKYLLEGISPVMQDIIKRCLNKDEKLRYHPELIIKKINNAQQALQNQSKVQSTSDGNQVDALHLSEQFACNIINYHNLLSKNRRTEATKMQLYETFLHNQENLNKLGNIQQLLFVKEATKAQFTVIVLLYYIIWLNEFQAIVTGKESSIAQNYRHIDKATIQGQTEAELILQIKEERARIKPVLKRSSQIARSQLKLMQETMYLPQKFKDMLCFGLIDSQKSRPTLKIVNLKQQITTFFERRIKKEYFSEYKDCILDARLQIIGQIGKGFK